MKVDVVVVTKNYDLPPVSDGGIPVHEIIVETSKPLAKARQRAIAKVRTKEFVFVDDDIILPDDWWQKVSDVLDYFGDDVGAVQGTAIPYGLGSKYDSAFRSYFLNQSADIWELNGSDRMFTHNTLIRTEAVKDWNPPDNLSAYEDYHMMKHIQKRGYKVFVVKTETYHLYSWNRIWTTSRWGTKGRLKFRPKSDIIKDFAGTPITFLKDGWCIGLPNFIRAFASMYEMMFGGR